MSDLSLTATEQQTSQYFSFVPLPDNRLGPIQASLVDAGSEAL
jgi:hypothetical protein